MNIRSLLKQIDWTILEELEYIPEGPKDSLQTALRNEYAQYRAIHRQLTASLPPRAALIQAIYNIRRTHPEFEPQYDPLFFFEHSLMSRELAHDPVAQEVHAQATRGGSPARRPNDQAEPMDAPALTEEMRVLIESLPL